MEEIGLEELYTFSEMDQVRFIGITTELSRYDFGIVFTSQFFGKTLVVCIESGKAALLDHDDVLEEGTLVRLLGVATADEASVGEFLSDLLPHVPHYEQAD